MCECLHICVGACSSQKSVLNLQKLESLPGSFDPNDTGSGNILNAGPLQEL